MKNYDETKVVRTLTKKRSISIDTYSRVIKVAADATDVGNGSWGKIDYLCHYCGYVWIRGSKTTKVYTSEVDSEKPKKAKRVDLVKNIKNIMKKVKYADI